MDIDDVDAVMNTEWQYEKYRRPKVKTSIQRRCILEMGQSWKCTLIYRGINDTEKNPLNKTKTIYEHTPALQKTNIYMQEEHSQNNLVA